MQEIGELAMKHGWESYIAYSAGRDSHKRPCRSKKVPVGNRLSVAWHGVVTRLTDRHGLASVGATYRFVKEIERIRPDVIHIHNIHGYFLNYKILFDYLAQSGIPVVWTVHDCWLYTGHCYYYSFAGCDRWKQGCGNCPQRRAFPASWWVDRSAQNFKDKEQAFTQLPKEQLTLAPVSVWMREAMRDSFLKEYPFQVIHNGIDLNTFYIRDTERVKAKYGLEGKRLLLGVASIWCEEKGLKDFVRLAGMVTEEEQIVLVGLKKKQRKALPKNIIGIARTENIGQLAELYSAADVLLNPTWQDNYPTVNLESISCGTPVVTYRTGGSVEPITEDTGVIVEQGDVSAMLQAARRIMAQGKEHYQVRCRAFAEAHFCKEKCYAEYLRLYERLGKEMKGEGSPTAMGKGVAFGRVSG